MTCICIAVYVYIYTCSSTCPKYITVYDHHWKPTRCPIQTHSNQLSYLGLQLDHIIANATEQLLNTVRYKINTKLEHLLDQPAPITAKIDFILSIILHSAQCANWSIKQYRSLDTPFNLAFKTILILPPPTSLQPFFSFPLTKEV